MKDFRASSRARRQRWFGAKRYVKTALSTPLLHPVVRLAARTVPGLAYWRLPAPARLREVVGQVGGERFVLLEPARCENAKQLYWGRGRPPRAEDALALDVAVTLGARTEVFLDVGAYTGLFTVAALSANPHLQGEAFEMVPSVVALLERNLQRNGLTARVTAHHAGVGDPRRSLRLPAEDSGSALPSFYAADMSFDDGVRVPVVALGDVAGRLGGRVVMKVDVEGNEAEVFTHAQQLLARRPDIICELLPGAERERLEALLQPHGMRYYLITAGGLVPREALEPVSRYRDWLLTAREPEDLSALGLPVREGMPAS